MRCTSCGTDNADTARFCGSCGTRLTRTCPHCRAEVAPGIRYCNACGRQLPTTSEALPHEAPLESTSERRLVSVVFLDLEDFTVLAESLDPEDVRTIQANYFEMARAVVLRYDGSLEKFIGDAVMAVWGAVGAHEDDAERAVRAALELVAGVTRLRGASPTQRLTARGAVTTGEAAVTLGLDGQGMVAGDLVNTAARLQAIAPSNGVLVDETTRRIVSDAVALEWAGEQVLKGKSQPTPAWRATGIVGTRGGGAGHTGPFVGRERELAELLHLQRRTVVDGRSRLVSVTGIGGIGKSRLMWEFEQRLDAMPDAVALHVGRAPSYGEGITFAPIAEMVRRRARILEGTPSEIALRQLAAALEELVPDEHERAWIEPRVASLLDPDAPAAYDRDELFAAWRRFFERVAAWAPALLVIEDLQWADASLIDFVEYLAMWARRSPMLIVTFSRPELLDHRPTWGSGLPSFTAIHLERLPDDVMRHLLSGLAPTLPDQVVRDILDRAGGVPLYAVDVVHMLLDDGRIGRDPSRITPDDPAARARVPETLHALISARLDSLPAEERALLLDASILGRRFPPDALAAVANIDPADARELVTRLIQRELLTMDDELRSPGRGQLSFVQDAVREVAYRTLSRRERRTLHLAAADHLAALDEPDLVDAAASHLVAAHRAGPDQPGAPFVAVRAVAALRQSAARAMALRAPDRASRHLEEALELVTDDEVRAELWQEAGLAARAVGRFDLAERQLRRSVEWHEHRGERVRAARARALLASLLLAGERHASALADLEAALAGATDLVSEPANVELAGQLARARLLVGDHEQALGWADRTTGAARALGLEAVAVDSTITRGTARISLGDEQAGRADIRAALEEARRLGLVAAELRARNNLAWLAVTDDPHESMAMARAGLELATTMGLGDMALQLADVACTVAIDTGDWAWALSTIAEIEDRPQAPSHRIAFACTAATIRALRGDPDADAALATLEPIDPATDPQVIGSIDVARAWILYTEGRFGDARVAATSAAGRLLGAEQHAALALSARAALWSGDADGLADDLARLLALRRQGRAAAATEATLRAGAAALASDAAADALYDDAFGAWRALRLPLHLALCLLERHRYLAEAAHGADLAEAEAILNALDAAGLLRTIRQLAPQGGAARAS